MSVPGNSEYYVGSSVVSECHGVVSEWAGSGLYGTCTFVAYYGSNLGTVADVAPVNPSSAGNCDVPCTGPVLSYKLACFSWTARVYSGLYCKCENALTSCVNSVAYDWYVTV